MHFALKRSRRRPIPAAFAHPRRKFSDMAEKTFYFGFFACFFARVPV